MEKTIYVIDDDPIFRLIARKLLEKQGLFTNQFFFENGSDGITSLKNALNTGNQPAPQIILLDIEMPVLDGWGFMEEFKSLPIAQTSGINLYVVSSSIAKEDRDKAASYPAIKAYLTKPLSRNDLALIAKI